MPGFTITGELTSSATGSTWAAVRSVDDQRLALKIVQVTNMAQAQAHAEELRAVLRRIGNEHVRRLNGAIALADGTLALVLDQVTGGTLAQVLGGRGQLTAGETITTVAPLFGALADLHAAGVVHGDLQPVNILFSADGRPLINDIGVARLRGRSAGTGDGTAVEGTSVAGTPGFVAPELVGGASPSPASDVYAMAALGWFCLAGAPPAPASTRPSLTSRSLAGRSLTELRPETPPRLVEVLTACLSTDPAARPSAGEAAVEIFDSAPAEPVALVSVSDPAAEITRRIRAAAVSAPAPRPQSVWIRHRRHWLIGVVALLVTAALGGGATWVVRRTPVAVQPVAVRTTASTVAPAPTATTTPAPTATTTPAPTATTTPTRVTDVVTAPDSPRVAGAGLLQALVDARALAYVSRNSALLDLVYAPGATLASADQSNIATALKNGATYLGLAFVVQDVAFLDGTSEAARIRATIVTPAYETGQPDGRRIPHAHEVVGPSVFTLSLTPDGWRILALTTP